MRNKVLAWLMTALLAVGMLPACSSGKSSKDDSSGGSTSQTSSPRALSAPSAVGASGVMMRAKKGSDTLEIVRAEPGSKRPKDLEEGTWTVFVYLCGSNLETEGAAATNDLAEMVGASGSEDVSFVVQTGGAKSWNYDELKGNKTQRLLVQDGSISEVDSFGEADMGEANTLADFLTWGVENYPAEHMGVILWNHGGGSLSGVCFDERNDDDSLVLRELDEALASTYEHMWDKFEFVGFDACLMGTLETANVLATYANYMYGSEESEPGTGWEYSSIMEYLADNPDATGEDLGKVVCDEYIKSITRKQDKDDATFSVVDLSRVDDLIQAFNGFSKELFEATEDPETLAEVVRGINEAENFGGNNPAEGYFNMVDVGGVVQAAANETSSSKTVLSALGDAVVYHKEGKTHKKACGLSMYYPLSISGSGELSLFEQVCVSPYYLSFVDRQARGATNGGDEDYDEDTWFGDGGFWEWLFSDEETGESSQSAQDDDYWDYVDENDGQSTIITFEDEPQLDEDGIYWFCLDEDGLNNTSAVSALVFMVSEDEEDLIALGETYDVNADWETGEFFDQFDGYWLSLPDGQNLCTYIADWTDEYTVYTCPIELNGERTNLRVRVYDEDYEVEVEGAWDGIGESGESSRGITPIEEGDVIVPLYDAFALEGEDESSYVGQEYEVDDDFYVIYDLLDEGTYCYEFVITDVYGNTLVTDPILLGVDDEGNTSFIE